MAGGEIRRDGATIPGEVLGRENGHWLLKSAKNGGIYHAEDLCLTAHQVAARLGIKVRTLRGWIRQGRITPTWKFSHKAMRFSANYLERWLAEHELETVRDKAEEIIA